MLIGVITLANLTGLKLIDEGHSHYTLNGERVDVVEETAIGQLARAVFAGFPPGFYFVIAATIIILFLAANTAFNGFPVLGSILARDGYLPRQLYTRGDRLAYSNGIVVLAVCRDRVDRGLPGRRDRIDPALRGRGLRLLHGQPNRDAAALDPAPQDRDEPLVRARMKRSRVINAVGLTMTGLVLVIVLLSKFLQGAYIAIIAMGVLFAMMKGIRRHYNAVAKETEAVEGGEDRAPPSRVRAIVLVSKVHKPTLRALAYAKASRPSQLEALTVAVDQDETDRLVEAWNAADLDIPLKVIASPYREVTNPIVDYVKNIRSESPRDVITVYIPEYVVGKWWQQILHNQSALRLKGRLLFTPGVLVTSVPYHLKGSDRAAERAERTDASSQWRSFRGY